MGRTNRAAAHGEGGEQDRIDFQIVDSQSEAQDIHNRVHGPDLVKMNLLHRNSVHAALRFSQPCEHAPAGGHHPGRIASLAQKVEYRVKISNLPLLSFIPRNLELRAGPARAILAALPEGQSRDPQPGESILKIRERNPQIDQRCQDHIAAGSAEQFEVEHEALYTHSCG